MKVTTDYRRLCGGMDSDVAIDILKILEAWHSPHVEFVMRMDGPESWEIVVKRPNV